MKIYFYNTHVHDKLPKYKFAYSCCGDSLAISNSRMRNKIHYSHQMRQKHWGERLQKREIAEHLKLILAIER